MARQLVSIKNSNGSIQLVYNWAGKRCYLSLGLPWDNGRYCAKARQVAGDLELDILAGRFAGDTSGYKISRSSEPASATEAAAKPPTLPELWEAFVASRRDRLAPSTLLGTIRPQTNAIARCPHGLDQPAKIRDWIQAELAPNSGARLLEAINACCKWAVEAGTLPANPMVDLRIRQPKAKDKEIDPFTADERDRILAVMAGDDRWQFYGRFVGFLFFTGCRPSEAVGLEWAHIAKDGRSLTFQQAATFNELGQLRVKAGLKSQQRRKVPINDRVLKIVGEDRLGISPYVFCNPSGGLLNTRNFAARTWRPVLKAAEVQDRNLYQCRHTFITLSLQAGVPIPDIARLVGNSPQVILNHYAGVSRELELPDL